MVANLWEAKSLNFIRSFIGNQNFILCGKISNDLKYIATGGWDKTVRIWDVNINYLNLRF
jgi:WD40 repeat protein